MKDPPKKAGPVPNPTTLALTVPTTSLLLAPDSDAPLADDPLIPHLLSNSVP